MQTAFTGLVTDCVLVGVGSSQEGHPLINHEMVQPDLQCRHKDEESASRFKLQALQQPHQRYRGLVKRTPQSSQFTCEAHGYESSHDEITQLRMVAHPDKFRITTIRIPMLVDSQHLFRLVHEANIS